MKRCKWSSGQKLKIVLEELSGQIEIGKLCNKYQVSQLIYYRWQEQLLRDSHQSFESKNITRQEKRLSDENQRLKQTIGNLTIEFKKANIHNEKKEIFVGGPKKCFCTGHDPNY